jgi:epoxide hydrolase
MHIQGTRPQTIAQSLVDSPSGLLAWIVEKFQEWTGPAARLPEDAVDRDRILTDVSIYWLHGHGWLGRAHLLRAVQRPGHVDAQGAFDRGGHFAALEAPDLLTTDVREFFGTLT